MALTGTLWPIHPKPKRDELLSSWLVRIARAMGMLNHTFCDLAFGGKAIWNRDIDKSVDESTLRVLAEKTATPLAQVRSLTLSAYEGWLYEHHNPNGNTRWILPLGIYHRVHRNYGLQYCPLCLCEDKEPYFRRRWRLAHITHCDKHQCLLVDRCSRCGYPVNFHRLEPSHEALPICPRCEGDLRDGPVIQQTHDLVALRAQKKFDHILYQGWVSIPTFGWVYSIQYFEVLHQLVRLMATGKRSQELRRIISKQSGMGIVEPEFPKRNRDFEWLSTEDRVVIVALAYWLLGQWPERFVASCRKINLLSSALLRDMNFIPYWYWSIVREYLYEPTYKSTFEEITAIKDFLLSNGKKPTPRAVSRLLGISEFSRNRNMNQRLLRIVHEQRGHPHQ